MSIQEYDDTRDMARVPSPSTNISIRFNYYGQTMFADMANIAAMTGCKWVLGPVEVMIFKRKRHSNDWDMGNPVFERYHDIDEFNEQVLKNDIEEFRKEMDAERGDNTL